jgi:RES domain-containing protein
MQVWRVCKQKHQDTAFSGDGGIYASGRWHPIGFQIVYTASSLALATLEVFVHTESNKIPLVEIRAYFSDDLETFDTQNLPQNWQEVGAYPQLQHIGKQWLQANQAPILKVPSSIVPVEFNYLLNPRHPDLKLTLDPLMAFKFDRRMWKSFAQNSKNK